MSLPRVEAAGLASAEVTGREGAPENIFDEKEEGEAEAAEDEEEKAEMDEHGGVAEEEDREEIGTGGGGEVGGAGARQRRAKGRRPRILSAEQQHSREANFRAALQRASVSVRERCERAGLTAGQLTALIGFYHARGSAPEPSDAGYNPSAAMVRVVYEGGASWRAAEHCFPRLVGFKPAFSPLPADAEERISCFVRRWRAHFVASMAPQALPAEWSVDYPVLIEGTRLRGKEEAALVKEFSRKD